MDSSAADGYPRLTWPGRDAAAAAAIRLLADPPRLVPIAANAPAPPAVPDPATADGLLVHADNLPALASLHRDLAGHVDLVVTDPPFGTGAVHGSRPRDGRPAAGEGFTDRWPDGLAGYLSMMLPRLLLIRELLAPSGSLVLHCDWRAAPALSLLCDELFGPGDRGPRRHAPGFRGEIVWTYGLGGSGRHTYPRKHDLLLWYSRGRTWCFDPPLAPATSQRLRGRLKKRPDVWTDIPSLNNMARERTGYPTQKPLALLERIVTAHSRPGDLVLDPFCGSGTTLVAARRLERRWIGIDAGEAAVAVTRERLARLDPPPPVQLLTVAGA